MTVLLGAGALREQRPEVIDAMTRGQTQELLRRAIARDDWKVMKVVAAPSLAVKIEIICSDCSTRA